MAVANGTNGDFYGADPLCLRLQQWTAFVRKSVCGSRKRADEMISGDISHGKC